MNLSASLLRALETPSFARRPVAFACMAVACAFTLGACSDDDPAPSSVTLTGVAAVGAPLVGATVTARCAAPTSTAPTTTNGAGEWTLMLAPAALPCALQASGGTASGVANTQALHSYAAAAGVANITPLTDLLVALAAGSPPAMWFAGLDATHPPALDSALSTAGPRLRQALTDAGYTPPSATFDPRTSAFAAKATDPYDKLLETFASGLAASRKSYPQLLTDTLAAASGGRPFSLPAFGASAPGTTPVNTSGDPIVLTPKSNVQPADIAALAGVVAGTFGSTTATGQPAVPTSSCSIDAKANGRLTVSAGGKTIGASMSGDVGDQILAINTILKVIAFDFGSGQVTVELVRGRVVGATATDASGAVSCTVANPHVTSAGTTTVQTINGATASDFDASLVGTYGNGTCTASVSSQGVIRVVSGSIDMQGTLGGDEQDVIVAGGSGPTRSEGLQAEDVTSDGRHIQVFFSRTAANLPAGYSAEVTIDQPRPVQRLLNCQNLVKQ